MNEKATNDPRPSQKTTGEVEFTPQTPIRATARPARKKPRHRGLTLSLLFVIGLPVFFSSVYMTVFAQDQYASTVGFTIRQEENTSASAFLGGLGSILGAGAPGNADLLFEFIQSQEIIERISTEFDLVGHYSQTWPRDPVFSLWPTATIEDLLWFWGRIVRVTFDQSSGLLQIQVRARDAQSAQIIAQLIVAESEAMINRLNSSVRADAMRNAEADLETALERLRAARQQ